VVLLRDALALARVRRLRFAFPLDVLPVDGVVDRTGLFFQPRSTRPCQSLNASSSESAVGL